MKDTKELKKEISAKLCNIPSWIDTTSSLHHLIWNGGILNINGELLKLITNKVLTEKTIFKVYLNVSDTLDEISEITPNELQMKIIAYYSRVIIFLEDICIQNENYESAANVKKFSDLYYNINPII